MYFVNDDHKKFYEHLTTMIFRHAKSDPEYHAVAYIFAIPDIYKRCIKDPYLSEYPFLWTGEYVDNSYTEREDGEEYLFVDFDVKKDDNGKELHSDAFGTLASGHTYLVNLAANLFNSSNDEFNLTNALGTWDDHLFKVYQQAVMLRINRNVQGMQLVIK